jgi:hypothetical protein
MWLGSSFLKLSKLSVRHLVLTSIQVNISAPGWNRTTDLLLRRQLLYPTELLELYADYIRPTLYNLTCSRGGGTADTQHLKCCASRRAGSSPALGTFMTVLPGQIYQHKNNHKYRVLHVVHDSTNAREGRQGVVYQSLDDRNINYRDLVEFEEVVEWPDGKMRSRFVLDEDTDI